MRLDEISNDGYVPLSNEDVLAVSHGALMVNGKPYVVDYPDEQMIDVEDGKLVTLFRGHLYNYWEPEQIKGYWA